MGLLLGHEFNIKCIKYMNFGYVFSMYDVEWEITNQLCLTVPRVLKSKFTLHTSMKVIQILTLPTFSLLSELSLKVAT